MNTVLNMFKVYSKNHQNNINLFSQCYLLIPLKTSENQRFSGIFKGIKRETLGRKGLKDVAMVFLSFIVNCEHTHYNNQQIQCFIYNYEEVCTCWPAFTDKPMPLVSF